MNKTIKQTINDFSIPTYITEILTNNYCPCFLRMSIIKEANNYKFSYNTDIYSPINYQELSTVNKLRLIRNLITVCRLADDYLIPIESFIIEPELVYSKDNSPREDMIHFLYYPDQANRTLGMKIGLFSTKVKDKYNRQESEVLDALTKIAGNEDWIKLERFIDKNIDRLVN